MKNFKKKSLIIALMIIIMLSIFQNYTLAATEISSAQILSGVDCGLHLQYKAESGTWYYITTHYQYYVHNGKEYPAYCLNREKDGATEAGSYTVDIKSIVNDVRIWRVAINGYPYKTPAQMGVDTWQDAYVATKQAIYSILYNRNVKEFYRGGTARGTKIADAIDRMVNERQKWYKNTTKCKFSYKQGGRTHK